tara:strand:- start:359 stop:1003 length:645 start_codon:yes stop_codon:yes gene_type:complete
MEEIRMMANELAAIKEGDKELILKVAKETPESQMARDMIKGEWDKNKGEIDLFKEKLLSDKKEKKWKEKSSWSSTPSARTAQLQSYRALHKELRELDIPIDSAGHGGQIRIPLKGMKFLLECVTEYKKSFLEKISIPDEILVPNIFPEDVSVDELEKDDGFTEITFEGVDYLEDEESGEIFTTSAKKVGKWNEDCDAIIWASDELRIDHETKAD